MRKARERGTKAPGGGPLVEKIKKKKKKNGRKINERHVMGKKNEKTKLVGGDHLGKVGFQSDEKEVSHLKRD